MRLEDDALPPKALDNDLSRKVWGSWTLSHDTLNCLLNEQVDCTEEVFDKKYLIFFEDKKSQAIHEKYDMIQVLDSAMADYLPFDSFISKKKDTNLVFFSKERTVNDLVEQLIHNIRGNAENVQEVIELVSNISNDVLIKVLSDVWQQASTDDEKKAFIKLISVSALSSHLFCKDILLTKLKEEKTFHSTMEIIYPVTQWLESRLIVDTLLPLLKDSSSPLVREVHYLKRCIDSFSNTQKSEFLSVYIDMIEGKLQRHDLLVLASILEIIPLCNMSIAKLVDLFSVCIMNYQEDRTLGKILLLIIDNLSSDTSKNILNDFSLVCNHFKGAMRFRIKAALKKKSNI